MEDSVYDTLAEAELSALVDALDGLGDGCEVELESGILTLEFDDGARYVVNSHRAARQIWMAADLRAWHFDWLESERVWRAAKSGDELWATLEGLLRHKLKTQLELPRPKP